MAQILADAIQTGGGSSLAQRFFQSSDTLSVAPQFEIEVNGTVVSSGNPLPVLNASTVATVTGTPQQPTTYTVTTGGTSVVALTGPLKGGWITNPDNASDQAIATAEPLYVDWINNPGTVGNNTTILLQPGQSWSLPVAIAAGTNVKVNASTSGHKFTANCWS